MMYGFYSHVMEDYLASGIYLSKKFHSKYGKIGLQTYGQIHLKQDGINDPKLR
jgi:hypothetical protein